MYCPDPKMKVNRFVAVAIPRNSEYMKRFGKSTPLASQYTGEVRAPMSANKVDMLYQAELMDLQQQSADAKSENNGA